MLQLDNRVNLVICQKSKVKDWVNHFKSYYTKNCILDITNKTEMNTFLEWVNQDVPTLVIGVINYDLIFRRPELSKLSDFTMMLDESSLIQNETAERSKFILKKLSPKNVILL